MAHDGSLTAVVISSGQCRGTCWLRYGGRVGRCCEGHSHEAVPRNGRRQPVCRGAGARDASEGVVARRGSAGRASTSIRRRINRLTSRRVAAPRGHSTWTRRSRSWVTLTTVGRFTPTAWSTEGTPAWRVVVRGWVSSHAVGRDAHNAAEADRSARQDRGWLGVGGRADTSLLAVMIERRDEHSGEASPHTEHRRCFARRTRPLPYRRPASVSVAARNGGGLLG